MRPILSEKRDSNSRPPPWQGDALPTELFSHYCKSTVMITTKVDLQDFRVTFWLAPELEVETRFNYFASFKRAATLTLLGQR
jgi:hypothetical protein